MRPAQPVTDIWVKLLPSFEGSSVTLQGRIREMMVRSILDGLIPGDAAMPPSRRPGAGPGCIAQHCLVGTAVAGRQGIFDVA